MKIALTTSGDDISAPLEPRFGRAPKFLIYDLETNSFDLVDNMRNVEAQQGAGIQAAETIARHGAEVVVTGHCGPKAFRVLSAAGIEVYSTDAATVTEALEKYRSGELSIAKSADVEGHWN
jgi:predicted Fe-Mo cluster-binding NifX family protein